MLCVLSFLTFTLFAVLVLQGFRTKLMQVFSMADRVPTIFTRATNNYGEDVKFYVSHNGMSMPTQYLPVVAFRAGLFGTFSLRFFILKHTRPIVSGFIVSGGNLPPEENAVAYVQPKLPDVEQNDEFLKFCECSDALLQERMMPSFRAQVEKDKQEGKFENLATSYIVVGYDTRKDSARLAKCVVDGIDFLNIPTIKSVLLKEPITTPLHHLLTLMEDINFDIHDPLKYLREFVASLANKITHIHGKSLNIDCANGVVALWARYYIPEILAHKVYLSNARVDDPSLINHRCGVEFISKFHTRLNPSKKMITHDHTAHFSSNGDKLGYSFVNSDGVFCYLDGFHIAYLILDFIYAHLGEDDFEITEEERNSLKYGVLTTYYTNGAFDKAILKYKDLFPNYKTEPFIQDLNNLVQRYDIGIYFSSVGYGIVHFSTEIMDLMISTNAYLYDFTAFFQYPTSDACATMLAVEYILARKSLSVAEWFESFKYLPWTFANCTVPNYEEYETDPNDSEVLLKPDNVRQFTLKINKSGQSRIYVRKGQKQNMILFYVEAETKEMVNEIIEDASKLMRGELVVTE